jgi:hypothetical protein
MNLHEKPAFPATVQADIDCHGRNQSGYGGMTYREYVAAKIMAAMYSSSDPRAMSVVASGKDDALAQWAVNGANALIAALANIRSQPHAEDKA